MRLQGPIEIVIGGRALQFDATTMRQQAPRRAKGKKESLLSRTGVMYWKIACLMN